MQTFVNLCKSVQLPSCIGLSRMTLQTWACYVLKECLFFLGYTYIQKHIWMPSSVYVCTSLVPRQITATPKCVACRACFEAALTTLQGSLPCPLHLARVLTDKLLQRLPLSTGDTGDYLTFCLFFFSLSELETDVKVFKETILEILDEEEVIEELCLSKWTDPQVLYVYFETIYIFNNVFCLRRT